MMFKFKFLYHGISLGGFGSNGSAQGFQSDGDSTNTTVISDLSFRYFGTIVQLLISLVNCPFPNVL